ERAMATKAQKFKAEGLHERQVQNAEARAKSTPKRAPKAAEPRNASARAGRSARVALEVSAGRPSRKSTRGSAHHQRAASQLGRTAKLKEGRPETRAAQSRGKAKKVRGKG